MVQIDRLFSEQNPKVGGFSFDENVARVFDDMICRSIPLYADVQRLVPVLASQLPHETITVVDLGCSTGTSLIHLAQSLDSRPLRLVGIDNSQSMLDRCHEKIQALGLEHQVETFHGDIRDFDFGEASIVLMNYTLQFVDVADRPGLLTRIRESLKPGGMLVVSEKVTHQNSAMDDALVELYFEFKRRNGYSDLEISRKRDALENVLVPLTVDQNQQMLRDAGFSQVEVILKWFNFATLLAQTD